MLCTHSQPSRPVLAANSLVKREVFSLPDPFAVVSVDGDQTYTTNAIRRTLSPAWNQHFDMSVFIPSRRTFPRFLLHIGTHSTVRRSSSITIQIFDEKRFRKRDQGFLGLVRLGGEEVLAYSANGHGNVFPPFLFPLLTLHATRSHQQGSHSILKWCPSVRQTSLFVLSAAYRRITDPW